MSSTPPQPASEPDLPEGYADGTGSDRWVRWIRDYLGEQPTPEQQEMLETVEQHRHTLIYGANGFGKTWFGSRLSLAWLNTHYTASVIATSGTYKKMRRTFCKEVEEAHTGALEGTGLPGTYKHSNPRIEIDGEPRHFFEADKPADAGELEGVHADYILGIIEEADKPAVTAEIIDSMRSLLTDDRDRLVVIANPPEDESNSLAPLLNSDRWTKRQYSSFDSHNVQIETGQRAGDDVSGLVTLETIREDWEEYNGREWPGVEQARTAHEQEGHHLDPRWLRRRAGVIPDADATKHRPFYADGVRQAFDRTPPADIGHPVAVGVDVARKGGDETVVCVLYPQTIRFTAWSHTDHPENERRAREIIDGLAGSPQIAVDAQGEGSGVADTLKDLYGATRFKNSEKAADAAEWDNKWTESLHHLGDRLESLALDDPSVCEDPTLLREDLFTAARYLNYENRALKSGDVYRATAKSELKDELGRSPDRLDALAMACWAVGVDTSTDHSWTW